MSEWRDWIQYWLNKLLWLIIIVMIGLAVMKYDYIYEKIAAGWKKISGDTEQIKIPKIP